MSRSRPIMQRSLGVRAPQPVERFADRVSSGIGTGPVGPVPMPDETRSANRSTGWGARTPRERCMIGLLRDIGYEVIPLKNAERAVLADVPTEIPLTVTFTASR